MAANLSQRPSPLGQTRYAEVIKTTPQAGSQRQIDITIPPAYRNEVIHALTQDGREEPPHSVTHLFVGPDESKLTTEAEHVNACETLYLTHILSSLKSLLQNAISRNRCLTCLFKTSNSQSS